MAYMSQEKKAKITPVVKEILNRYGVKGSLSIHNHSTLILTLKSGHLDFVGNYNETMKNHPYVSYDEYRPMEYGKYFTINTYHYDRCFSGKVLSFVNEIIAAMHKGNHDNSDIMTDYFDVGWYIDIRVGKWNKPYIYEKKVDILSSL